jgi:hypothetical protein
MQAQDYLVPSYSSVSDCPSLPSWPQPSTAPMGMHQRPPTRLRRAQTPAFPPFTRHGGLTPDRNRLETVVSPSIRMPSIVGPQLQRLCTAFLLLSTHASSSIFIASTWQSRYIIPSRLACSRLITVELMTCACVWSYHLSN